MQIEREKFNHKAYKISPTGSVKRDWIDLLKSDNAQRQTREARKLSQRMNYADNR